MTKLNWKTCIKVGVSLFLLFLAIHYWESVASALGAILGAAVPLIIGGAIAYLINILMVSYEKIYFPKSKKKFCIKNIKGETKLCLLYLRRSPTAARSMP